MDLGLFDTFFTVFQRSLVRNPLSVLLQVSYWQEAGRNITLEKEAKAAKQAAQKAAEEGTVDVVGNASNSSEPWRPWILVTYCQAPPPR